MDNSGERNASRRGRGRQHLSQPTDGGAPAAAQLAFLLGMLMQLVQVPRALTPQPPTSQLPSDNLSALNAPQSTSPSRFEAPLLHRLAAESHDEAEDTSSEGDASPERIWGAETAPSEPSDSWHTRFDNLLSIFQNARPGVKQPTKTKGKHSSHPARKMTFPQSRSAPSRSSQTRTPSLLPGEVYQRGFSEPSRPAEELAHVLQSRTSQLPRDASAASLTQPQSYPANHIQVPFQPGSAAKAHEEEDTSDASDTIEERKKQRIRSIGGAEVVSPGSSDSWQTQLLEVLSKLESAGFGAEQSTTTTTARRGERSAQLARGMSFPQSMSAPSRSFQLHKQFLGSGGQQVEVSEPSPPPSPLSEESLENYLQAAYIKWKSHHGASVQLGDAKKSRSRVVHRRSRRSSQAEMFPAGPWHHLSRWSWPGRVPEESQSYLHRASRMSRHSDVVKGIHSGRSDPRFAVADDDTSDDSLESSGEDFRNGPSHLEVERRRVVRESSSAPSHHRNTPADYWLGYDGEAHNSQHMQRAVSAVWNPYATSETSFTKRRRPPMLRPPSHRFTHNLHGKSTFSGTRDSFASSAPQFWTEAFGVNSGPAVDITNKPHSTRPVPSQANALQPVNMTVQFYNHPGHVSPEELAARSPHPHPSGNTQGRPMQSGKRRSSSTTEARTPRATETRRGSSQAGKAKSHTSNMSLLSSVEKKRSDSETKGVHEQPAQNAVEPGASAASPPLDLIHDHGLRGESSKLSFPVTEVGSHERLPQVGSPSSVAAALPSSAAAPAGAASTRQFSLQRSRIPVSVRRVSTESRQPLASSSFSLPHTLRREISPQPGAAPPPTHTPQVSSPGYRRVQTLEQQVSQSGAATAKKRPDTYGGLYYTAQSSQGGFLSLPSASQHPSLTMRGESSEVRGAPSGPMPSQLQPGGAGRTTRTANVPQRFPVEHSFLSLSQEQLQRSLSTGGAFMGMDTPAFDSPAGQPVEDEFMGDELVD